MHLFVNGEQKSCPEPTSLAQLVDQLGMKGDRVAVELNREIIPRSLWSETELHDGDRLEIVHFVGGGNRLSVNSRATHQIAHDPLPSLLNLH